MDFGGFLYWDTRYGNSHMTSTRSYTCGYCGNHVSSEKGLRISQYQDGSGDIPGKGIYLCPNCKGPTFFDLYDIQHPGYLIGQKIKHIPENVDSLYEEARNSFSVNAFTGVVLLCRKLLMNIAVSFGAEEGKSFASYVQFLFDEGYVSKSSKQWVDHIRKEGNSATHEIEIKTKDEAKLILLFAEMILRSNFEYPASIPIKNEN